MKEFAFDAEEERPEVIGGLFDSPQPISSNQMPDSITTIMKNLPLNVTTFQNTFTIKYCQHELA